MAKNMMTFQQFSNWAEFGKIKIEFDLGFRSKRGDPLWFLICYNKDYNGESLCCGKFEKKSDERMEEFLFRVHLYINTKIDELDFCECGEEDVRFNGCCEGCM